MSHRKVAFFMDFPRFAWIQKTGHDRADFDDPTIRTRPLRGTERALRAPGT